MGGLPDHRLVTQAIHHGFLTLAGLTILSSAMFWRLKRSDGEAISRGAAPPPTVEPVTVTSSD